MVDQPITNPISGPSFDFTFTIGPELDNYSLDGVMKQMKQSLVIRLTLSRAASAKYYITLACVDYNQLDIVLLSYILFFFLWSDT